MIYTALVMIYTALVMNYTASVMICSASVYYSESGGLPSPSDFATPHQAVKVLYVKRMYDVHIASALYVVNIM